MKGIAEQIFKGIVPQNEGYTFLFQDNVYLPVFNTILGVTKRIVVPLNLVEEKVLQLIDAGVYHLDEISNVLGLQRKLLDITVADLYVKEFITTTSDSCKLLLKGRKALNELATNEKRQDILKDVYLNSLNGEILTGATDYELIDKVREDDNKLKPILDLGNLQDYVKRYKEIKDLFDAQNREIVIGNMKKPLEELLSIDRIVNIFIQFIKVPICVFVSNNGIDIDILCCNSKMTDLIVDYKDIIIRQIVDKKVLKKYFAYKKLNGDYAGVIYEADNNYLDELKRYYFFKKKTTEDKDKIEQRIFSNRKLYPGEYELLVKYLSSLCKEVVISVERLDDWAYSNSFIRLLVELNKEIEVSIEYEWSRDIAKARNQIAYNYKEPITYLEKENGYYISWSFDNLYRIYGIPQYRKVIDETTDIVQIDYFLEM